jgi:hypothetical protein
MNHQDDGGAGASSGRNKLAAYLRERGLDIPTCFGQIPDDEDFWWAIQKFAKDHGAVLPMKRDKAREDRAFIYQLAKRGYLPRA